MFSLSWLRSCHLLSSPPIFFTFWHHWTFEFCGRWTICFSGSMGQMAAFSTRICKRTRLCSSSTRFFNNHIFSFQLNLCTKGSLSIASPGIPRRSSPPWHHHLSVSPSLISNSRWSLFLGNPIFLWLEFLQMHVQSWFNRRQLNKKWETNITKDVFAFQCAAYNGWPSSNFMFPPSVKNWAFQQPPVPASKCWMNKSISQIPSS